MLLERLEAYKRKVEYYENQLNKGDKSKDMQIYNQLFDKYNKLLTEFEQYKENHYETGGKNKKKDRKQIIDLTRKEKQ